MRSLLSCGVAVIGLGLAVACATPADDAGPSSTVSAFTVESGSRFVVSATPRHIVLRKHVDGAAFPFDKASLAGKALLIHPIARDAATGVYARALDITEEGDHLVVESEPLTFQEMENITEDQIVRIFIDAARVRAGGVAPLDLAHPAGADLMSPFDLGSYSPLSHPDKVSPGLAFSMDLAESSLRPEASVTYSKEKGLGFGLRAALDWHSTMRVSGQASGEFFRSREISSPSFTVPVPIGPAVVPIVLKATAFISCNATLLGPVLAEVSFDTHATVAASANIRPSATTSPSEWVTEGAFPGEATGDFKVANVGVSPTFAGSFECGVPRIELQALVAGVAGPYIAAVGSATLTEDGLGFEGQIRAGFTADFFVVGKYAYEKVVYRWKP